MFYISARCARHYDEFFICRSCVLSIAALFDSGNHGKELHDGVMVLVE